VLLVGIVGCPVTLDQATLLAVVAVVAVVALPDSDAVMVVPEKVI